MNKTNVKPLAPGDVIRITRGKCAGRSGVINRFSSDNVNIFLKGEYIGIWFSIVDLKRIGRVAK